MRRPKVVARPAGVAETRHEKVITFEFPDGRKGKISLHCNPETGGGSIMFYDCDPDIVVYALGADNTIITGSRKESA